MVPSASLSMQDPRLSASPPPTSRIPRQRVPMLLNIGPPASLRVIPALSSVVTVRSPSFMVTKAEVRWVVE